MRGNSAWRELGVLQREPLGAGGGEANLHARVQPAALEVDHHALAELGVRDVLADRERSLVRAPRLEGRANGALVAVRIRLWRAAATRAPRTAATPAAERGLVAAAILELLLGQHQPLAEIRRDLLHEARDDAVARLAVQHAASRIREVQALPRARDRDVHEAPLLLDAAVLEHAVVVREEAFLEPRDEDGVELEALRGMHRHELQRILARRGFVLARLEACMRQ